jgi:DNA polymerase-3 subunit alpha
VFQVEGSGMRRWLMQMKPTIIEHVIAMVALFRPGPMESIPNYIRRMHGEDPVVYKHPLLEPIFKETYGFPVYQEQLMRAAMQLAGYTPPESDDLRKAIAKKIKDKLLKHKEKFVHGAVARGIPEETAGVIFDDWEEFARYGFNKSHAADYGIIAVQTAHLKCHYPEEYMTALLSVSQNDTDKVALYVADCRRMGIPIKPPSVNSSEWDFAIEDQSNSKPAIRFGLGAVKNVGHGPVDAILEARGERAFANINDFARRVDLRSVGKRPLESLIRVGALDELGTRSALLSAMDQILSISASHFRASDAGQMSMFGAQSGISDEIILPRDTYDINRREILEWERELIGLYVSDHPLSPLMDALTQVVTHFSGQLSESSPGEKVRVAGIVTRVRPHQTKAGKNMGFVTLEDVQGNIELVVFPRTWDQYWETFEVDNVVLVDGKVDAQSGDPKVLVDTVTSDTKSFTVAPPLPAATTITTPPRPAESAKAVDSPTAAVKPMASKPTEQRQAEEDWGNMPPPPEEFDPDWNALELAPGGFVVETKLAQPSSENPVEPVYEQPEEAGRPEPSNADMPEILGAQDEGMGESSMASASQPGQLIDEEPVSPMTVGATIAAIALEQKPAESAQDMPAEATQTAAPTPQMPAKRVSNEETTPLIPDTPATPPPYVLPPAEVYTREDLHMVTVALRQGYDKVRDNLRLRQCYGILISYSGRDRFALQIFERNRGYRVEFPNYTTTFCPELMARLASIVGVENVIVEPLRLH